MSEATLGAIIGVIGTLLGTSIGFILSEVAARNRQNTIDKKQGKALRVLLEFELNYNLKLLRSYWDKVKEDEREWREKGNSPYEPDQILGILLSRSVLPTFITKVWEAQMPLIATTFAPNQIRQVHSVYYVLHEIERQHHNMVDMSQDVGTHPIYAEMLVGLANEFSLCTSDLLRSYPFVLKKEITSSAE